MLTLHQALTSRLMNVVEVCSTVGLLSLANSHVTQARYTVLIPDGPAWQAHMNACTAMASRILLGFHNQHLAIHTLVGMTTDYRRAKLCESAKPIADKTSDPQTWSSNT